MSLELSGPEERRLLTRAHVARMRKHRYALSTDYDKYVFRHPSRAARPATRQLDQPVHRLPSGSAHAAERSTAGGQGHDALEDLRVRYGEQPKSSNGLAELSLELSA